MQQLTRDFVRQEVTPRAHALDRTASWPTDLVARLGELGLMGVGVPEALGGAGLDAVTYALVVEEVSYGCASLGVICSVNNSLCCEPLQQFGTPDQKETHLRPLASGGALGCFGLTEPESGSDAGNMATVATAVDGGWSISGAKNFITNGPEADTCIVFASTGRENRSSTAFIVPLDLDGVSRSHPDKKMGIRAAHSCTLHLDQCVVPESCRLGATGGGFKVAMATLDGGRIGIAAQAVGIARAAYERALAYSQERVSFGSPIASKQAIRFMLSDMATELEAARLLTWYAASLKQAGQRFSAEAASAKLYASEMSMRVTHRALQIHGGYGYMEDYHVERHVRDARITEIYEGTSEIMRLVVARSVLQRT